jgi:hypothetical protein
LANILNNGIGDENGRFSNETTATLPPAPVKAAQQAEAAFVKKWVAGLSFGFSLFVAKES